MSLKQVIALLVLGDTNRAKTVFDRINSGPTGLKDHEALFLQSFFEERRGEFENARQKLLSAVGEYHTFKDATLARIYNNLGRMEGMLGNMTNVCHYYRKSTALAYQLNDKALIHIVYQNLIDTYLLMGDGNNANASLTGYSDLTDKENVDDLIKFNNYTLQYARQTQNRVLFVDTLVSGRIEILPKITMEERLVFEVSELRIRRNSQCGIDEKLFWLAYHLPEYLNMRFPQRYFLLKEVFNILRDPAMISNLGPFQGLFSQLIDFMGRSKDDIDAYVLDKLPDYCVDERCFWEKEKAFLRKIQKQDEPPKDLGDVFEGLFEHLRNVKDIQLEHGNLVKAIDADLCIIDECMGLIQGLQEATLVPYLRETMAKHLNNACTDLEKFRSHPVSNEYLLRIARYALFMDDKGKAKEYFDDFIRSKVSIFHYASWMQQYYQDLVESFDERPKGANTS